MYTYDLQYKGLTITKNISLADVVKFTIELLETSNTAGVAKKAIIYDLSYNLVFGSSKRINEDFFIETTLKEI